MIGEIDLNGKELANLTLDEAEFYQYLSRHSELKTNEIAEDFSMTFFEAEKILNSLRDKEKAVEIYDSNSGYLWSAL